LVPIYGYCANTVLTQAISHTLDDVIYARENEQKKKWNPRNGYQTKPPLESWMAKDENGELVATRETELGRVQLALGVFRGLMDLHEGDGTTDMEWLPVVHADLQAKQYLIDSDSGKVYLNDFNRCRFIAKKDSKTPDASNATLATKDATPIESCPIYIPTAPGYSRSPEEYNGAPLTEKLDVYSAGNILYGIITGKKPFNGERGKHIKEDIQTGKRPKVDAAIRDDKGTVDAELVRLLDRVYEADPDDRASAKEIVVALEQLLEKVLAKSESVGGDSIEQAMKKKTSKSELRSWFK
jgi:serine/threonine protein kinase